MRRFIGFKNIYGMSKEIHTDCKKIVVVVVIIVVVVAVVVVVEIEVEVVVVVVVNLVG